MVALAPALFGLFIGSFLNVVIYRVPAGGSVVAPPSACPGCSAGIAWYDNIPVLSWLMLRGRCRGCNMSISSRYPLVEAGTAVVFFAVALWALVWMPGTPFETVVGAPSTGNEVAGLGAFSVTSALAVLDGLLAGGTASIAFIVTVVAFLYLAAVSIALTMIDIDVQRLPNVIVLPSIVVGGVLIAVAAALAGEWGSIIRALIGLGALFMFYFLLVIVYPKGMGLGDVKLAALLGLYLGFIGWGALAVGAFAAFLLGGIFSIGLLIFRKAGRKSGIPFGPWMILGAWVGIFFGERIASAYLALFGLS